MENVFNTIGSNFKVAVVEDDIDLNDILAENLFRQGYNPHQIFSGYNAVNKIIEENPDAVLLDRALPGVNGDEICKDLRSSGFRNSIIMLTGQKGVSNQISAYGVGVSGYLEKPFNIDILLAILKNKLESSPTIHPDEKHVFHDMVYYPQMNILRRANQRIELSVIENQILLYLVVNSNKIIPKSEIESYIYKNLDEGRSRSLDMHIMRLRKKIEQNSKWPKIIITIKGKGVFFKKNGF